MPIEQAGCRQESGSHQVEQRLIQQLHGSQHSHTATKGSSPPDQPTMLRTFQFTLAYLLLEVALVSLSIASLRLLQTDFADCPHYQSLAFCLATTAACGALGGLFLRMTLGLIAGSVFSLAAMPSLCLLLP